MISKHRATAKYTHSTRTLPKKGTTPLFEINFSSASSVSTPESELSSPNSLPSPTETHEVDKSETSTDTSDDQIEISENSTEETQLYEITLTREIDQIGLYAGQWDDTSVTFKLINKATATSACLHAFDHEIALFSQIKHPHIIQYHWFYITPQFYQIVMEPIPDKNLLEIVLNLNPSLNTKLDYIRQILTVLVYLHLNNIIHRDLNPNIFFVDQNTHRLKLCDISFAVDQALQSTKIFTDKFPKSIAYMAPEVLLENPPQFSTNSDMFSFAVLAWFVMTGIQPKDQMTPDQIKADLGNNQRFQLNHPNIPKNVASLIKQCWIGGTPKSKESVNDRASAEESLEYFDDVIQKSMLPPNN